MRKTITHKDILAFEQRYRTAFINSLGGFKSIGLIGTRSVEGKSNLAIFNSFFHLGAHPPLFGFVVRPDSVERHTWENIKNTRFFTVNHVNSKIYEAAHQTSARYSQEESEFAATGLTEWYEGSFGAPFVAESSVQIGAEYLEHKQAEINGTIIVIASVCVVHLPADSLGSDGFVDLERAGSLTGSGLDAYHITGRIARLAYAKPGTPITKIG